MAVNKLHPNCDGALINNRIYPGVTNEILKRALAPVKFGLLLNGTKMHYIYTDPFVL